VTPRLVDRRAAAEYLGVSVDLFRRKLEKHFTLVSICAKKMFELEEIRTWVDAHKAGGSSGSEAAQAKASHTSSSRGKASRTSSPQVREIRQRLERKRKESLQRLSVEAQGPSSASAS
jgi:hypothetical protein